MNMIFQAFGSTKGDAQESSKEELKRAMEFSRKVSVGYNFAENYLVYTPLGEKALSFVAESVRFHPPQSGSIIAENAYAPRRGEHINPKDIPFDIASCARAYLESVVASCDERLKKCDDAEAAGLIRNLRGEAQKTAESIIMKPRNDAEKIEVVKDLALFQNDHYRPSIAKIEETEYWNDLYRMAAGNPFASMLVWGKQHASTGMVFCATGASALNPAVGRAMFAAMGLKDVKGGIETGDAQRAFFGAAMAMAVIKNPLAATAGSSFVLGAVSNDVKQLGIEAINGRFTSNDLENLITLLAIPAGLHAARPLGEKAMGEKSAKKAKAEAKKGSEKPADIETIARMENTVEVKEDGGQIRNDSPIAEKRAGKREPTAFGKKVNRARINRRKGKEEGALEYFEPTAEELRELDKALGSIEREAALKKSDMPEYAAPKFMDAPSSFREGTMERALMDNEGKAREYARKFDLIENNFGEKIRATTEVADAGRIKAHARKFSAMMDVGQLNEACKFAEQNGASAKRFLEIFDDIGEEITATTALRTPQVMKAALVKSVSLAIFEANNPKAFEALQQAVEKCGFVKSEGNLSAMQEHLVNAAKNGINRGKFISQMAVESKKLLEPKKTAYEEIQTTQGTMLNIAAANATFELMPEWIRNRVEGVLDAIGLEKDRQNMMIMDALVQKCNEENVPMNGMVAHFKSGFAREWLSLRQYVEEGHFAIYLVAYGKSGGMPGLGAN